MKRGLVAANIFRFMGQPMTATRDRLTLEVQDLDVPVLDINDPVQVADFVVERIIRADQ